MKRFTRSLGEHTLVCQCSEALATQANALLTMLEALHRRGPALHDRSTIQFGWSLLTLVEQDGDLLVCEPDFEGDPLDGTSPTVDRTLRVQARQAQVCRRAHAVGPDVRFDHTIIARRGFSSAPTLYLDRTEPFDEFSGWFVGPTPDTQLGLDEESLEVVFVHQLLALRADLLDVMQLPVGYHVVTEGSRIAAIVDASGVTVGDDAGGAP
jgi:hypothetical protein